MTEKNKIQSHLPELTHAEEEVMQVLWMLNKGFVNDLMEHFPEPRPAYNTISTVIRILEKKGFVGHKAFGKTHQYFPKISKEGYSRQLMGTVVKGYFDNSYRKLVSFFTGGEQLTMKEMEDLRKIIDEQIELKKANGHE